MLLAYIPNVTIHDLVRETMDQWKEHQKNAQVAVTKRKVSFTIRTTIKQIGIRLISRLFNTKRPIPVHMSETVVDSSGQAAPEWKEALDHEFEKLTSTIKEVNVLDYGAVGDGKTDSTDSFKKAIGKGKVKVKVPAGVYVVKGMKLPSWTYLIGEGKGVTIIRLHDLSPKRSWLITNANHVKGDHHIAVEGMSLDWNLERLPKDEKSSSGNNRSSCLMYANVTYGWVREVEAINPGLHCFDVSSTVYTYTGDGTRAKGGSNYIWLDRLNGYGFGDDGITTHHSDHIFISNSHMCDPSGRAHAEGFSNSNGIEVDDGSRNVWLSNNSTARCFGGVEIKAHATSSAARNVHIFGHLSVNDHRSFNFRHIGHHKADDPESTTAFNITAANLVSIHPVYTDLYKNSKPRSLVVSAYRNVVINYFTAIGDPDYDYRKNPVIAVQYKARNVTLNHFTVKGFTSAGEDIKVFGGSQKAEQVAIKNVQIDHSAKKGIFVGEHINDISIEHVVAIGKQAECACFIQSPHAKVANIHTEGYKTSVIDQSKQLV
ncbi:glycosyl hydrolase family 28-related protein [Bacillus ectoiniformans]|uniref:glycosyl hydrolase family 28-related protein n=1 Tax=Bacillus ectoiniformans TaxID=1494429 RepID=UPI00195ACDC1|nr:glycosyl hydrolase family 28-related protein [Bacillus ectoiniformans]